MIKDLICISIIFVLLYLCNSINPSYLIFSKLNGYFEEINRNKYLALVPTNESKEITKNIKNCGVKS